MAAGAVRVAASLIAVGVAVLRGGAFLRDLGSNLAEDLAAHLLILLELPALASSTVSHGSLLRVGTYYRFFQDMCHGKAAAPAPAALTDEMSVDTGSSTVSYAAPIPRSATAPRRRT